MEKTFLSERERKIIPELFEAIMNVSNNDSAMAYLLGCAQTIVYMGKKADFDAGH